MNWKKKIDEESESVHNDQSRAAQPRKKKFNLDSALWIYVEEIGPGGITQRS